MKLTLLCIANLASGLLEASLAFGIVPYHRHGSDSRHRLDCPTTSWVVQSRFELTARFTAKTDDSESDSDGTSKLTEEEKRAVGNLVADDEWNGLTMELSEMVRLAVAEDIKKKTKDFIGKDDYKVGDISKEIDVRVKEQVATMRGKEDYELGDLVQALDELSKEMTCKLTGNDTYEFGDLSLEIDKRVKSTVADYCGAEEYEFGMLAKEVDKRVRGRVAEFTGKSSYSFGDITAEVNKRRQSWVKDFLGEEAAKNYQFGDVSKKAFRNLTGKDEYQFGDVTKAVIGKFFAGKGKGRENDKN